MLPATAGDPISGLKWTRKTTLKLAEELGKLAIEVSARTVARLLEGLKFRLRVNHKKLSRGTASTRTQRNEQFQYIEAMRRSFAQQQLPVISVDTKKKELVGCFRNAGAVWAKTATPTNDHDFRSDASHIASPYGVFDPLANRGHVFVGISYDTPAFATDCISRWWNTDGRSHYPKANKLLILADSGGSNGSRCRAWKHGLMAKLCMSDGLQVTVCHFPPGASKWNPIEHRLFSQISRNWAGEPLLNLEKMLNFIRTTKTTTGLRVRATLMKGNYPKGIKPTDADMAKLPIQHHELLPDWNYTITAPQNL